MPASRIFQFLFGVEGSVTHYYGYAFRNGFDEIRSEPLSKNSARCIFIIAMRGYYSVSGFSRYNVCPLKFFPSLDILYFYTAKRTSPLPNQ
jgi:hypothetical protein